MPKPENIEPYKMKKGQTLNPNGRPRKTISAVNVELEAVWPQYVKTVIRFSRHHHLINWNRFKVK